MSSPAPVPARIEVRPGSLEAWRIAVRTRTLWIATVPVFVGTSVAYLASGEVDVLFASLALVASVLLQAIANLQNDVGYTARGAETGTRIGLPRATSTGLLTPREVRLAIALAVASPLASADPDGLERVAADIGFLDKAQQSSFQIIPDYVVPGIQNQAVATILAGVIGLLIVFALAYGIARMRRSATA